MKIYAIADLHFSNGVNKSMNRFGENWISHDKKIMNNWNKKVNSNDYVLIAGDISWATTFDDAKIDLELIDKLPGKKIISRGNHDYWWKSLNKLNNSFNSIKFIQSDVNIEVDNYIICGTRGWISPNEYKFNKQDKKIYERELKRLDYILNVCNNKSEKDIILMLHYPPTNEKLEMTGFVEIINKYNVKKVIYGHLHGQDSFKEGLKGNYNNVEYILTSSDYLNFDLIQIK